MRHSLFYKMKKAIFFITLSFLLGPLFCEKSSFYFKGDLGSLLIDDSGNSFVSESLINLDTQLGKINLSFDTKISGIKSSLDYLTTDGVIFSSALAAEYSIFKCGLRYVDFSVPKETSLNLGKFSIAQSGVFYKSAGFFGEFDFSRCKLGFDFSFGSGWGSEGELYITPGTLLLPDLIFAKTYAELPENLFLEAGFVHFDLNAKIENSDKGVFSTNGWYGTIKKDYCLERTYKHLISTYGFYAGALGNGNIRLLASDINLVFFPYSYFYYAGNFNVHVLGLGVKYTACKNRFAFETNAFYGINILSNSNTLKKYTYQKTIIYDGSSEKEEENKSFGLKDSLFYIDGKLSFDLTKRNRELCICPYLGKKILIPIFTSLSNNTFSDKNSDFTFSAERIIKMFLLSGITIGIEVFPNTKNIVK